MEPEKLIPFIPPTGPITREALVERLISDGIAEVERTEAGIVKEGCLAGFNLASTLPCILEDFEAVIEARNKEQQELARSGGEENTPEYNNYMSHRFATMQLEWIRDVLIVARANNEGIPPPRGFLSGRAIVAYARIIGVDHRDDN